MSNRVLSKASFAEFADPDTRNSVLQTIRSGSLSCSCDGKAISIKPGLTAERRSRNWALTEAEKLVRAHPEARDKVVVKKGDATARTVTVDGVVVYEQTLGGSDLGKFSSVFTALVLPVSQPRRARSPA